LFAANDVALADDDKQQRSRGVGLLFIVKYWKIRASGAAGERASE